MSHNQPRAPPANMPQRRHNVSILPKAFCSGPYKTNKNESKEKKNLKYHNYGFEFWQTL